MCELKFKLFGKHKRQLLPFVMGTLNYSIVLVKIDCLRIKANKADKVDV